MKTDYFTEVKKELAKLGTNVSNADLLNAECLSRDVDIETGDKKLCYLVSNSFKVVIYEEATAFLSHCATGLKVEASLM